MVLDVQEILLKVPIPLQTISSSSMGDTFGITSDVPSGYYADTSGDVSIAVLRGATGSYAMQNIAQQSGPFFVAATIDTPEPIIPGTNIPVYMVSALLDGGMSVSAVLKDFPSLTRSQVEDAKKYARANPHLGKPYPKKTLKHFLRKGTFRRLQRELTEIGAHGRAVSA